MATLRLVGPDEVSRPNDPIVVLGELLVAVRRASNELDPDHPWAESLVKIGEHLAEASGATEVVHDYEREEH